MTEPLTLRDLDAIGVERIKGVGEKKLASLHDVGVDTVLDLLTTYPRRWVDRTNEARVSDLLPGQEALVLVSVRSVTKRAMRNRRTMVNVVVGDGSGRLQVVFFNQPWREKQLREGLQVALFGKAEVYRGGLQMTNPVVDLIGDRTGRIVPVYPQSEKAALMTWEIAGWVEDALRKCSPRGIADPVSGGDPAALRADRTRRCVPVDPRTRHDRREGAGPAATGLRRAVAGADDAGDAQAHARARVEGDSSHGGRGVDRTPVRGAAVRAHRRAATGDRRDRERSRRPASDAPTAAGRRRLRQDPGGGQRDADGCAGWSSGSVDGADRSARRAARRPAFARCSRASPFPTRRTCSAIDRCASSC